MPTYSYIDASLALLSYLSLPVQYGKDYEYEAPVKLLDKLLHEMPQSVDEQIVVVSQVSLDNTMMLMSYVILI